MRRILWMLFLFGAYIWVMTSGHDRMLLQYGKSLYNAFVTWFDDADVDFQVNQTKKKNKKRSRRWD